MARSAVARQLVKLGGRPDRQGVVTDNGNVILDVHGTKFSMRSRWKTRSTVFGVVTVGLFANRGADVALIGTADGVKTIVNSLSAGSRPALANFSPVQFGDFCHIYATILIYTLPFLLFLVFCPAISSG